MAFSKFSDPHEAPTCDLKSVAYDPNSYRITTVLDYGARKLFPPPGSSASAGHYQSIIWGLVLTLSLGPDGILREWCLYEGHVPDTSRDGRDEMLANLRDQISSWGDKIYSVRAAQIMKDKQIKLVARFGYRG